MVNVDKQDFVVSLDDGHFECWCEIGGLFQQENTALHDAAWHGYSAIVEMLLSAKSNVYVRNKVCQ